LSQIGVFLRLLGFAMMASLLTMNKIKATQFQDLKEWKTVRRNRKVILAFLTLFQGVFGYVCVLLEYPAFFLIYPISVLVYWLLFILLEINVSSPIGKCLYVPWLFVLLGTSFISASVIFFGMQIVVESIGYYSLDVYFKIMLSVFAGIISLLLIYFCRKKLLSSNENVLQIIYVSMSNAVVCLILVYYLVLKTCIERKIEIAIFWWIIICVFLGFIASPCINKLYTTLFEKE
jgi:hypothetical protein